jgi:hypothetical protein
MSIPKVFISYSHDSTDHKKWVMNLATRLRNNGIDAIIDQWELGPGGDIPSFMEEYVKNSDYVIIVCTEEYVKKANSGTGGVGYEKMIITSDLMKKIDSKKVIPVIRQNGTRNTPIFVQTKLFLDFSYDKDFEYSYDELVRTIHNSPLYEKPKIGNNPFTSAEPIEVKKPNKALNELIRVMVEDYDAGNECTRARRLWSRVGVSRILFETIVEEAIGKELIELDGARDFLFTPKGKKYAIDNALVKTIN